MDPISLAMFGTSALSSILGGNASREATQLNNQISLLNYYEQVAANQRARQEGRRQQAEAKLGTTDAYGNRTYFIPGVGWVTDLDETQQQIQDASEQEQLRQLSQGARDEVVQERAATRRGDEDILATEADREFRQARRDDPGALRQLFLALGAQQRNQQADRAGNLVARAATRGGGTNAAEVRQGARATSDADSARQAGIQAELMAQQEADRRYDKTRGGANALYDYFRKMSTSGTGSAPVFQPQGPASRSTANADQQLMLAMGRTPQFDYQQPDYSTASTLSDITNAFGGYYDRQNSQKYNQAMLDAFGRMGRG